MTRHPAFEGALERCKPDTPACWRLLLSLQTLRCLDNFGNSRSQLIGIRVALSRVKPVEWRNHLRNLINGVLASDAIDVPTFTATEPWARYLLHQDLPALAADVFRMMIVLAHRCAQPVPTAAYHQAVARAVREAGDYHGSRREYNAGVAAAKQERNPVAVLLMHIGLAALDRLEGNLVLAADRLERVRAEADVLGNHDLQGRAAHDSGVVELELGIGTGDAWHCATAIPMFETARSMTKSQNERQRLRIDVGRTAAVCGCKLLAHRAVDPVLRDPCERRVWVDAKINEIHFAILADNEKAFDRSRKSLEPRAVPGPQRALYWHTVAQGFRRFGHHRAAHKAQLEAERIAKRIGLNEVFGLETTALLPPVGIEKAIYSLLLRIEHDERENLDNRSVA